MKKVLFFAMTALMCMSCAAKKPVAQQPARSANPFGDTFEAPCTVYDTPEHFAATGIFRGSSHQLGEVQKGALLNAQELVRLKCLFILLQIISLKELLLHLLLFLT